MNKKSATKTMYIRRRRKRRRKTHMELESTLTPRLRRPRKASKAVFKKYNQDEILLLPPELQEYIPENHIVKIVNETIERLEIQALLDTYKGNGTSSYHPRMLIKVLVYSYIMKIYSSRKIAKALREDITFMWISGKNTPDFRTINNFRSGRLKGVIDEIFTSTLEFMVENKYVSLDKYFIDGSKFRADANKYSWVWKKNTKRYMESTKEKIKEILGIIEEENAKENKEYGDSDLEELGECSEITSEKIKEQIKKLNGILKDNLGSKKIAKAKKDLEQKMLPKLEKYEEQEQKLEGRNSYSKTDTDATFMRGKDDQLLPMYNVMIGTEGQFVVNYTINQSPSETNEFKGHIEDLRNRIRSVPKRINGDSAYGSEENYEYLEELGVGNYLKYNTYYRDKKKRHKEDKFHRDNFTYDESSDTYECTNKRKLIFKEIRNTRTKSGYLTESKVYECESCKYCRLGKECKKTKGNRTIQVNEKLEYYRDQARKNLESEEGIRLRKERGVDVETVWGDIKKNQAYDRFRLRTLPKVNIEFGILSIAHNIKKMFIQMVEKLKIEQKNNAFLKIAYGI
jgi:transposase